MILNVPASCPLHFTGGGVDVAVGPADRAVAILSGARVGASLVDRGPVQAGAVVSKLDPASENVVVV